MKQWSTLVGYSLVTFTNAIIFGIFSNNLQTYSEFYNVSTDTISNTYYISVLTQILICIPSLKMIQWRLDYAVFSCAYLTACSYWLIYFSNHTFAIAVVSYFLNSIGSALTLPISIYMADVWFQLEKRSFVIGIGFYINMFGYSSGAILATLYVGNNMNNIQNQFLILAILSSLVFLFSLILVKNKPKVRIQKLQKVQSKHMKLLWKNKFMAYNILGSSAFLGVSWTFESTIFSMDEFFTQHQIGTLTIIWILSGGIFGLITSFLVNTWFIKTGQFKYYDWACKILLFLGLLGYFLIGLSIDFHYFSYPFFIFLMILIGIGSIGFYGLVFMSMIQSLYPLPSVLIGTILVVGASAYSFCCLGIFYINQSVNIYFCMAITLCLPWLYFLLSYQTNFKRYKAYLNQKEAKYELIKLQEVSIKEE